jgi:hypothetical protein
MKQGHLWVRLSVEGKKVTRPINETPEDRRIEAQIIERFNALVNKYDRQWCPRLYPCDAALTERGVTFQPTVFHLIEAKRRYWHYGKYPEVLLGLYKWATLSGFSPFVPVHVVFQLNDKMLVIDVKETTPVRVAWAGNNRGQEGDKEPCVMLPTEKDAPRVMVYDIDASYIARR